MLFITSHSLSISYLISNLYPNNIPDGFLSLNHFHFIKFFSIKNEIKIAELTVFVQITRSDIKNAEDEKPEKIK